MKRHLSLFLALAAISACDLNKTPTQPTPPLGANAVSYTAIGASDAIGYGGSVVCVPFTACPEGTGYVQDIVRKLQGSGKTVTLLNLGIPGAVLSPTIENIGNSINRSMYGNFLDREVPFVATNSTLVTVFAGGNDVNTIGAALDAGLGGADQPGYIATQTANFGRDMRALVAAIRARSAQARIVVLNLPNMAALPYASGYSLAQKRALQQIAVGFSAEINALTSQGVIVVDLMCDSHFYQSGTFSGDGFHPNDAGYAYLTDVVYAAITATSTSTAPAPRASCSQMSQF